MKLTHAISGAAVAAALLIGFGATTPAVQAKSCTVSNIKDLKDRCPAGLKYAEASAHRPVVASMKPTITPVSYTTHKAGCIKTNIANLKGACPAH